MTKALLLLLSFALIAAGVFIVWRDVHRRRREAFLVRGDATAVHPEVEVMVARPEEDFPLPRFIAPGIGPGQQPSPGSGQSIDPAARWASLRPVLDAGVERVNVVLAGAGLEIGASGEPSWSLMKRGYGVHRRLLIGGESVAWLRLELGADGQVQTSVKSHKDELAAINATASAAADGLDIARASDLLSEALKLAAAYAVHGGGASHEQLESEYDWRAIDPLVSDALRAANGAFGEAGARFVPLGPPAWADDVGRHRLAVRIEVLGTDAARLHVERIGGEVEVAVGLGDARLASLGRRERLPVMGLTTHALAELIASCSWPAIAHFRERVPQA
jgi:hypothetical protein